MITYRNPLKGRSTKDAGGVPCPAPGFASPSALPEKIIAISPQNSVLFLMAASLCPTSPVTRGQDALRFRDAENEPNLSGGHNPESSFYSWSTTFSRAHRLLPVFKLRQPLATQPSGIRRARTQTCSSRRLRGYSVPRAQQTAERLMRCATV